jgi:hypothetical protein
MSCERARETMNFSDSRPSATVESGPRLIQSVQVDVWYELCVWWWW